MEEPIVRDDHSALIPEPQALGNARRVDSLPRRIEWIAIVLVVVNSVMMLFSYSLYYDDIGWGKTVVAIYTATAVVLLLSVFLSVFGLTRLSAISLGVGIVALMASFVILGVELIDRLSFEMYFL
jgi:FlaA1/EpsC-like NDP-sugar epimerase